MQCRIAACPTAPGTGAQGHHRIRSVTDAQIVSVCQAAVAAGADFVKTSTGFHPAGGATLHAVRLMKETVGDRAQVKASGGVRSYDDALAMLDAGASRLGVSGSAALLSGATPTVLTGAY